MPTGYTAAVQDGQQFKEFALSCARAFGAAIMQRDDPMDAPLQTVVEPSDYHIKAYEKAIADKAELDALQHWQWSDKLDEYHNNKLASIAESKRKAENIKAKYSAVLQDVHKWQPPTPEHQGIKDFMAQQLNESIGFDCLVFDEDYTKPTLDEFKEAQYKSVNWSIEYHDKKYKEEVKRCAERTKWLQDFVNSL